MYTVRKMSNFTEEKLDQYHSDVDYFKQSNKKLSDFYLGDLNYRLPISGRECQFKELTVLQGERLSKIHARKDNIKRIHATQTFFRIMVTLQYMCIKFDGHVFFEEDDSGAYNKEVIKEEERMNIIRHASHSDVIAAFIMLGHSNQLDEDGIWTTKLPVGKNDEQIDVKFDLNEFPLLGRTCLDSDDVMQDMICVYRPKTPIKIRKKECKVLAFAPYKYMVIEDLCIADEYADELNAPRRAVANALVYADGLSKEDIDSISEYDFTNMKYKVIQRMYDFIKVRQGGFDAVVKYSVEGKENSDEETYALVPWLLPNFLT